MTTIDKVGSPQLCLEKYLLQQSEADFLRQSQRGFLLTRPILYAIALGSITNLGYLFYSYSENPNPNSDQESAMLNYSFILGGAAAAAGLSLGILHKAAHARSLASKSLNLAQEALRNFELYFASTQSSVKFLN